MGLAQLVTTCTANLVAMGYDAIEITDSTTAAPDAGRVCVYTGPEHLEGNDAPPRVVFVPGDVGKDKFGPSEALGGATRQMFTRFATAEVHVWGQNYAEAEQLVNDVVIALQLAAKQSVQFSSGGFVATTRHMQCGREYVFGVGVAVPIVKPTLQTAPSDVRGVHGGYMKFPNSRVKAC